MDDFARNITSYPSQGPPRSRQRARIRLFARLRQTAFPFFFPAIKATRPSRSCCFIPTLFSVLPRLPTMSVRYGVFRRLPAENRLEMSALDLIVSNVNSHYTQRRLRPFARRARSTARPPLVDMRARKPWHFARLRLFGW